MTTLLCIAFQLSTINYGVPVSQNLCLTRFSYSAGSMHVTVLGDGIFKANFE